MSISSAANLNLFGFSVLFQIIEAELHRLEKEHPDCISANTSVEQLAVHEVKNTKRLWMNVDFATIKKIFVPMNPSGCHWNLLV